jgi:hypothetical protein
MPHVIYLAANVLCPWPGCGYRVAMVDFQLELMSDPSFYTRAMKEWGRDADYGLIGRCPGCRQYVLFASDKKVAVTDPQATGLLVLPDDWHQNAIILQNVP